MAHRDNDGRELINAYGPIGTFGLGLILRIESVELYDRHPEIFIYLAEFVPSVEKAFPELMERSKRAWTEIVGSVLRLRPGPEPADVDLITYGVLGMFSWMHRWYRPGGPRSAKEIGELYARVILKGIEPRP